MSIVTHDPNHHRYLIHDEDSLAGSSHYRDRGEERIFFHTEIGEEFGGRGLAGILTEHALTETAALGVTVVAVCPYVRGWLEKHDHSIPWRAPTPNDLTWLKENLA